MSKMNDDQVEWDYLEAIMIKLGFDTKWVQKISNYVNSVSFRIALNGFDFDLFKLENGLTHIDPWSGRSGVQSSPNCLIGLGCSRPDQDSVDLAEFWLDRPPSDLGQLGSEVFFFQILTKEHIRKKNLISVESSTS